MQIQNHLKIVNQSAVMRMGFIFVFITVIAIVLAAIPHRFQMLEADVYDFAAGLDELGISLSFFAFYFTFWELFVIGGSLLVAALIAWKKGDDWFAMLVATSLCLFGLLTPLIEGLRFSYPTWEMPIVLLRMTTFCCLIAVFCLFPNGRFLPGWTRWWFWAYLLFTIIILIVDPTAVANTAVLPNTRTVEDARLVLIGGSWFGVAIIGQFVRYHKHSTDMEKQQTKWVLFGFSLAVIFSLVTSLILITIPQVNEVPNQRALFTLIVGGLYLLTALALPATITLSILRFRLWDVDLLINRTLVYGGLTASIVFLYALIVGGLSLLLQSQNNFLFSLLATGLIALLFQPVRDWLQRGVNRMMFGERDDPYKVLSHLGRQLQSTALPGQSLPAVVSTITQTLKLPYAAVELAEGDGRRLSGAQSGEKTTSVEEWPLQYQGETVGWLLVAPRSEAASFNKREKRLLDDIAAQAGAAAHSVRLLAALQKSRERLVFAREEERLRIRRDLHDELGPSLASQTFRLDSALDLLDTDPQKAAELLESLKIENQSLVNDIRRLVYELRPPALDELGLQGALQAHFSQYTTLQIVMKIDPDPLPKLPAALEVAAYRIILEAVTNTLRHAKADQCTINLQVTTEKRDTFRIVVEDNGVGLPKDLHPGVGMNSMRERAEELGGSLTIASVRTGGVQIKAILPIEEKAWPNE